MKSPAVSEAGPLSCVYRLLRCGDARISVLMAIYRYRLCRQTCRCRCLCVCEVPVQVLCLIFFQVVSVLLLICKMFSRSSDISPLLADIYCKYHLPLGLTFLYF